MIICVVSVRRKLLTINIYGQDTLQHFQYFQLSSKTFNCYIYYSGRGYSAVEKLCKVTIETSARPLHYFQSRRVSVSYFSSRVSPRKCAATNNAFEFSAVILNGAFKYIYIYIYLKENDSRRIYYVRLQVRFKEHCVV